MNSKPKHSRTKAQAEKITRRSAAALVPVTVELAPANSTSAPVVIRKHAALSTWQIAIIVGVIYYLFSFFIFRHVIANIPLVLSGQAVINGDELVPFFNPHSQLLDQAAGKYNQLTNGYEFRVRYAILTTWLRYYKILQFAIPLVIPGIAYASYLVTAWLISKIFPNLKQAKYKDFKAVNQS